MNIIWFLFIKTIDLLVYLRYILRRLSKFYVSRIEKIVQAYQATAVQHGIFIFTLFSEFSRYPELSEVMDVPLTIFQNIGELIARYQTEGMLVQEQPLYTVATLLAPVMYISTIRNAQLVSRMPELDLAEHVTAFLKGRQIG